MYEFPSHGQTGLCIMWIISVLGAAVDVMASALPDSAKSSPPLGQGSAATYCQRMVWVLSVGTAAWWSPSPLQAGSRGVVGCHHSGLGSTDCTFEKLHSDHGSREVAPAPWHLKDSMRDGCSQHRVIVLTNGTAAGTLLISWSLISANCVLFTRSRDIQLLDTLI